MSKTSIFKWVKKNLVGTIVLGAVLAYIAWIYVREINGMSNPRILYYPLFLLYAQVHQGHLETEAGAGTYYIISLWDRL
jgi:hypothetical protein